MTSAELFCAPTPPSWLDVYEGGDPELCMVTRYLTHKEPTDLPLSQTPTQVASPEQQPYPSHLDPSRLAPPTGRSSSGVVCHTGISLVHLQGHEQTQLFCCYSTTEISAVAKDDAIVQVFDSLYLHKETLTLPSAPLPSLWRSTEALPHLSGCSHHEAASRTCLVHAHREHVRALATGSCSWQRSDSLSLEGVLPSLPL